MSRAAARSTRLRAEALETRDTPATVFAVASAFGAADGVTVYDGATRAVKFTLDPYPGFAGGINVAVGDVNGDGTADVITAPGVGGAPTVNVYSGVDGSLLRSEAVGDAGSRNGADVAAADYDGDGRAELVVGTTRNGQPLVQVIRFADGSVVRGYTPFGGTTALAGVSVAAADVTGDGVPDTVVGAGAGGGPRVTVFNGATDAVVRDFFAFETTFAGGLDVSAGTLADGRGVVSASAGFGGGPRVQVFSVSTGAAVSNFFAYDSAGRAGVRAALTDADGDGALDLVTAGGRGQPVDLKAFDPRTAASKSRPAFPGLPVGASDVAAPTPTLTSTAADPTRSSPLAFTATFNEAVNNFAAAGLSVTNGSVANFARVDARTYTFDVVPSGDGAVSVFVAAGTATDAAGNANAASATVTRAFDATAPAVTADALTTNDSTPTITGTVSESAAAVSVTVGGQTFAAMVSGTAYSAAVPAALADGTYTIEVTATDAAGNSGTASAQLVVDTVAPAATLDTTAPEPTNVSPIPYTLTFGEDVTGFTLAGLSVTNGVASGLTAVDARTYTFSVAPSGQGAVTVTAAAGAARDAAGNGSAASNVVSRTFDTGAIALTVNALVTNDSTPTITGTVGDPAATVTVTAAGQTVTATVSGNTFSATLPAAVAEGTYDVVVSAVDAAGNTGSTTRTGGLVIDLTAPAATLATTATDPTNLAVIPFTLTFSETVTGLTAAEVVATNGTVSGFTAVSATTYTFDVVPTADGAVTVSVAAGAAQDAAGNGSTAASRTFTSDRTAPTVAVASTAADPTDANPIPFTVTFSESVSGFVAADVAVTGGSIVNFAGTGASYSFGVVPAGNGQVTVSVAAGAAQDSAGNASVASNSVGREFAGVVTTAQITSTATSPTNLAAIPVQVVFSGPVTDFDISDVAVTNGVVSNFAGAGTTYTFDVAPTADGAVTVDVAAGAATDGNNSPTAAATFSIVSDRTAPTATVATTSADPNNLAAIPFSVTFSEPVLNFTDADLTVGNGGVSNFATTDNITFTFDVTPSADGPVSVSVAAGVTSDAAGNGNAAAAAVSVTSDRTAPTAALATTEADPTSAASIPFTVTFSESVTGLALADLTITNGTASNLAGNGASYTFDVAPAGDGPVSVTVNAGAAADAAGNGNDASNAVTITSERFDPTATVTTTAGAATNQSPIPFTVTFSEDVTGFSEAGLNVTNGAVTADSFTAVDARTYTFTVTPAGEGAVTVFVAANAAVDAAGKLNPASAPLTVEFDTIAPTAALATTAADPTNLTAIPFAVTFAEEVNGFTLAGVAVTNGTPSNLATADNITFTFDVTPTADGAVTVTVNAGAAQDAAGNNNIASNTVSFTSDRTAPTAALSTAAGAATNQSPIPFTVTFSDAVANFDAAGLTVNNGAASNFATADGGLTYTFDVTPDADGAVTVVVNAGAAVDAAGNTSVASAPSTVEFDTSGPAATITTTAGTLTNQSPIPFTVTFSEDVGDFDETDLTVTNGTVSNFAGSGTTYTFDVTPAADGPVSVSVATGLANDAAGNDNTAGSATVTSDRTAPTVTVTGPAATNADPVVFTVTFNEAAADLDPAGLTAVNGTVGTVARTSDRTFTVQVTPSAEGNVTLTVPAGAGEDLAGNVTAAGASATVTYDIAAPTGEFDPVLVNAVSGAAGDGTGSGVSTVMVSIFDPTSERFFDGTGFTSPTEVLLMATDTSGAGDFSTWEYAVDPGDYSVRVVVTDAAGNVTQVGPADVTVLGGV